MLYQLSHVRMSPGHRKTGSGGVWNDSRPPPGASNHYRSLVPDLTRASDGGPGQAWFAGTLAREVVEVATDPAVLDRGGWWAVVITFEGVVRLWRLAGHEPAALPGGARDWPGLASPWSTSVDQAGYLAGVREIRRRIREGEVYQVNLCRLISTPVSERADPWALAAVLARGNPAPYAGVIDVPAIGGLPRTRVVTASPELFLRREGDLLTCSPIKGTGRTAADLLPKDTAENVMIVDLMRNDLQHTCRPGTVEVTGLLQIEQHPGLVHLVSTVQGRLAPGAGWTELLSATMPPGSVSGAPKSSALRAIADLEPVARGPYCGAIGWVDADAGRACLAVGIRTFWWDSGRIHFGTGAGITWSSDPAGEWAETELKAARLTRLASGTDLEKGD
jgi:para-aminobenzoate synthetase component 1